VVTRVSAVIFLFIPIRSIGDFKEDTDVVALILAGLLLCVMAGIGMAALRFFKFDLGRWEYFGVGTALGMGFYSYMMFGLGMLGWLYTWSVWTVIGILIPPAVWGFVSLTRKEKSRFAGLGTWERLGIIILIWCSFFNSFMALAPPFFADCLKYHLAAPKWYISLHQIQFAPVMPFNMPQNLQMINLTGLLLHSDTLGFLFHYFLGILAALGIWALAREFLKLRTAIWAAVIFYAGIPHISHAAQGVDLGPIFFTVWSFYAFVRWRKTHGIAWLSLAGILAGLCAALKYTGIYTPFALFIVVAIAVVKDWRIQGWKDARVIRSLSFFLFAGIVSASPWYLRNLFVAGDPFYPILYPYLGGKGWNLNAYQDGILQTYEDLGQMGRSFLDYLISPLKYLWMQNRLLIRGGVGLLIFSFAPSFFLMGKKYLMRYSWLIIFSLPFYAVWVSFTAHGRFLLPLIALWAVPSADVAFELVKKGGHLRFLAISILLLGVGMGTVLAPVYAAKFIPVVIGKESKDTFLSKTTWFYQDIQWMNANLPADARVASECELLYYLDRDYIWTRSRQSAWIDYSGVNTPEEELAKFRELGITHLFAIGKNSLQKWDTLVAQGFLELLYYNPKGRMVLSITLGLSHENPVAVYRIRK
jgi:hypothetical protein